MCNVLIANISTDILVKTLLNPYIDRGCFFFKKFIASDNLSKTRSSCLAGTGH